MFEFAGIDGTGSEWFSRDADSYREAYKNSHVRRLHDSWFGKRHYFEGPELLGLGTANIAHRATRAVSATNGRRGVVLAGYSRGGAAAIVVAQQLAEQGVPIECLILFDAVHRSPAIGSTVIPGAVPLVLHAMRDPAASSRESFGSTGHELENPSRTQYERRLFRGTHGAIGGVPWEPKPRSGRNRKRKTVMGHPVLEGGIDLSTNVTYAGDAVASREVWKWISSEVRRRFGASFRG